MIKEYLSRDLSLNKLYNTYLISVDDLDSAKQEVLEFISSNFYQHQNALTHPDFMLVQKMEGNVKNISVEQIRDLQNFLNKTSIISGYKTTIIYGADQMNINAVNSCLKLLEDTSKDTYIFLITNNVAAILPTIRSRCAKIKHNYVGAASNYFDGQDRQIDDYYIRPLLKTTKIDEHLSYLKAFSSKDRDLWIEFTTNIQILITRICKKITIQDVLLSPVEMQFLEQLVPLSVTHINNKYDELVKLTEDTIKFDLDLRASYILLVKILNCNY
ncbi:MAG: DNA polymerase III subunit delta' [Rickettsiaceae bacterium]